MTLRDSISADASLVFLNNDEFAESITYVPRSGPSRTINAVVFREQIQTLDENATVTPIWQIHVANDSTDGITSDELDLGGDKLTFPPRDGKTALTRSIVQLLTQDHGILVVECQ